MLKLFKHLSVYKWLILAVFGLVFIQSMSDLYLPTLMSDIIDEGVVPGKIPVILKLGVWMLIITALGACATILSSYYASKVAMGFGRDLRRKVFHHVETFSLHEFNEIGTASLITRTTNDIQQIQQVVMIMLRMVVHAPFMLVGGIIMAISKDAKLSMIIFVAMPVLMASILLIFKKGMPLFRLVQEKIDRLNLVLRENLTGVRVIRAFNREPEEKERLKHANGELMDVSIKVNKLMAFMMPIMMLVMNLTVVAIIWFGGIRIDHGSMEIGDLMAFIQYIMLILFALVSATMMFIMLPRAAVSANRINEVLETSPTILNEEKAHSLAGKKDVSQMKGTLEFDHVTFSYPGAEQPVLKDISFTARPGETTAIIGGTGSGKSTLVQLIPRFYDVTKGAIRINGVDIRQISQEELRTRIGYVPQKALLFTGTIGENIRFGKEDASMEEIKHAAKIAQADEFIQQMKDGYDSFIEQGGLNLSGGQKQRLSIARALVRKPDIYIFDDSFSALDYRTDAKLRAALKNETKNSTVIIVAQRVSTVMEADQIAVLDEGKIAGIGTHEELLATNELYKEIVRSQLSEGETA